jgi:hypothetical protein
MPDVPVAGRGSGDYDPRMEERMARVEQDISEVKGSIRVLEHAIIRIEAMLGATLPHLATKAELNALRADVVAGLAEKPSKTYMWGILSVLLTAYACGLAALAILR